MDATTRLAADQLSRMRGMTAMYHRRFFFDVNLTTLLLLALLVIGWWRVEEAFLLVPVAALMGAMATAFAASYLVFARWYSAYLESYLNDRIDDHVLVGSDLEGVYLFPLGSPKIVTIPVSGAFSWFSFVTVFYATLGALAYVFGFILGWGVLTAAPTGVLVLYLIGLFGLTLAALVFGIWWFVRGEGERRLQSVLDDRFGEPTRTSDDCG
ncbi:MAG: hypothetical protein ACR2N7_12995 [Acidimicrobiia bacterium]